MIARLHQEETGCYRLFHGVNEGRAGLSVDAYGPLTLAQVNSRTPLSEHEQGSLTEFLGRRPGPWVLVSRQGPRLHLLEESLPGVWSGQYWCRELGCDFAINLDKAHRDPQLFLDFRACKRRLRELLRDRPESRVLNLFAYTCSVSAHCAAVGNGPVVSVDFSSGNLKWGEKNFRRNRLKGPRFQFLSHDCLHVLWSLTGKENAITRKGVRPLTIQPALYDLVVVDPPAFAKGKFGNVDLVHDPETIYSPAWSVVASGGWLLAANNSARVTRVEFEERLRQLIQKSGQGCRTFETISPDQDFPTRDGEHPLKVFLIGKE